MRYHKVHALTAWVNKAGLGSGVTSFQAALTDYLDNRNSAVNW